MNWFLMEISQKLSVPVNHQNNMKRKTNIHMFLLFIFFDNCKCDAVISANSCRITRKESRKPRMLDFAHWQRYYRNITRNAQLEEDKQFFKTKNKSNKKNSIMDIIAEDKMKNISGKLDKKYKNRSENIGKKVGEVDIPKMLDYKYWKKFYGKRKFGDQSTSQSILSSVIKTVDQLKETDISKKEITRRTDNFGFSKIKGKEKEKTNEEYVGESKKIVLKGVLQFENNTLGMNIVNKDIIESRQGVSQPTVVIRQVPLTFNTSALLPLLPAVFGRNVIKEKKTLKMLSQVLEQVLPGC